MTREEILEAIRELNEIYSFGDLIYTVRDRVGDMDDISKYKSSWDHPLVEKWAVLTGKLMNEVIKDEHRD